MRQPPGQEPQEESHLGTQASDRHDTPRGSMPGHQYLATPKLCTPLTTAGRTPRGRGGEAEMYPMWENMRYPMVFGRGIPPEGGPSSTPLGPPGPPSLTLQVRGRRRPRLGGGLFSLPQVATGIDVETGTAPPHGRGPLFASQRSPPESTSSGTRRPRMRGGLFSLPQVATSVDFGKDWRRVTLPPASLRAFHRSRLSCRAAPRLRTRSQIQVRDGLRREELGAARQVPSASLRAFLL